MTTMTTASILPGFAGRARAIRQATGVSFAVSQAIAKAVGRGQGHELAHRVSGSPRPLSRTREALATALRFDYEAETCECCRGSHRLVAVVVTGRRGTVRLRA